MGYYYSDINSNRNDNDERKPTETIPFLNTCITYPHLHHELLCK